MTTTFDALPCDRVVHVALVRERAVADAESKVCRVLVRLGGKISQKVKSVHALGALVEIAQIGICFRTLSAAVHYSTTL